MEFYLDRLAFSSFCIERFNSQRDGILQKDEFGEYYLRACFNSQRDGILQCYELIRVSRCWLFQFPTGWNSTQAPPQSGERLKCFNSQRDGILPSNEAGYYRFSKFQFPTGWNSTNVAAIKKGATESFNSQRDGILQNIAK